MDCPSFFGAWLAAFTYVWREACLVGGGVNGGVVDGEEGEWEVST